MHRHSGPERITVSYKSVRIVAFETQPLSPAAVFKRDLRTSFGEFTNVHGGALFPLRNARVCHPPYKINWSGRFIRSLGRLSLYL